MEWKSIHKAENIVQWNHIHAHFNLFGVNFSCKNKTGWRFHFFQSPHTDLGCRKTAFTVVLLLLWLTRLCIRYTSTV